MEDATSGTDGDALVEYQHIRRLALHFHSYEAQEHVSGSFRIIHSQKLGDSGGEISGAEPKILS